MHHRRQFARFTPARAAAAASAAIGIMLACAASALTAPPLGDTYIVGSGTNLTKNYGAATTLGVGAGASTLIQFNLAALPAGTLPTDVASATLLLYVNKVTTPGTVALQLVSAAWSEGAVTGKTAPAAASAFTSVGVPGTALGQYVLVDVTTQVKGWIGASSTNNGFMLTPAATAPTTNVFFDSKETGGNAPALEITLALRGPTGATGAAGAQGPAGAKGDTGAQGQTGANGAPGSAGAQGPAGPAGLRGPAGAYTWLDKNGNFVGVADGIGVALAAIGQAKVHISIGDFPPIQNTKVGDNNRAFLAQVGVYYLSTNCSGQAYVPMSQVSTGDNRASGGMYDLAGNAVLFLGDDAVSQSLAYGSTKSDASVCDINPGTTLLIPANASYLLNTLFPPPLRIQ